MSLFKKNEKNFSFSADDARGLAGAFPAELNKVLTLIRSCAKGGQTKTSIYYGLEKHTISALKKRGFKIKEHSENNKHGVYYDIFW